MQVVDICRILQRLEHGSLGAAKLLNGTSTPNQIRKLINDGMVRRETKEYYLLDKGKSFLKNHQAEVIAAQILPVLKPETSMEELITRFPMFSVKQINNGLQTIKKEKPMFNIFKQKQESKSVSEEETFSGEVLKIVNDYGDPINGAQIQELLTTPMDRQQIHNILSYLTKSDKIVRLRIGTYASKSYSGEIPGGLTITDQVVEAVEGTITLQELEKKLPQFSSTQIVGALANLKNTERVFQVKKGVYSKEIVLQLKELTLTDLLVPPMFVNIKLGDAAKARKYGGDYMMAFHLSPDLFNAVKWSEKETVNLRFNPMTHSLTLFPSEQGFPVCLGDGAFAVGFPIPEGKGFPKPASAPVAMSFEIKDRELVCKV